MSIECNAIIFLTFMPNKMYKLPVSANPSFFLGTPCTLHIGQLSEHISAPKTKRKNVAELLVPESVILTFCLKVLSSHYLTFCQAQPSFNSAGCG